MKSLSILFLLNACLNVSIASAKTSLQIGTPSGVSHFDPVTNTIYGGIAGGLVGSCSNADGLQTCSNCMAASGTPFTACNQQRIYDNLILSIPLKNPGNVGVARMTITSSTGINLPIDVGNSLNAVRVPWSSICASSGITPSSCENVDDLQLAATIWIEQDGMPGPSGNEASTQIKIVVVGGSFTNAMDDCSSAIGTGICAFRAYPGGSQVFISDLEAIGAYPNFYGTRKAKKLRFYFSSTSFEMAYPGLADKEADLNITADGSIADRRIGGLKNGNSYFVRSAIIDNANNIDALISDQNISQAKCSYTSLKDCPYYVKVGFAP